MAEPMTGGGAPASHLGTSDGVRRCWLLGHLAGPRPSGYWHVRVDPPIAGSMMGFVPDQDEVVLAERWAGTDVRRLDASTVLPVFVCAIVHPAAVACGTIAEDDVRLVATAEVARDPALLGSAP